MFTFRNHIRTVATPDPTAGGGDASRQETGVRPEDRKTDESKDFSRALSKRAAEIEAKYSDYADLKAKAMKYDEAQEAAKTEAQKLQDRLEKAEEERDALKAAEEHGKLVDSICEETGLDRKVVSMLSGDDKTLAANAEALREIIGKQKTDNQKKQGRPLAVPPNRGNDTVTTAKQLLSQAYAEK
ncbi:MAG: hypothetical protein SOI66_09065 [Bifidobacterium sp.]|jgi:regulator of replication initiation timing